MQRTHNRNITEKKPEKWLRTKQACDYIGRSDDWLRQKRDAGKIECRYVEGGRPVYEISALDALMRPKTALELMQSFSK